MSGSTIKIAVPVQMCPDCEYMKKYRTAASKKRWRFICSHPEAACARDMMVFSEPAPEPGFICFSISGEEPATTHHPHWCPLRLQTWPKEISEAEADEIREKCAPSGLFYYRAGMCKYVCVLVHDGTFELGYSTGPKKAQKWLLEQHEELLRSAASINEA